MSINKSPLLLAAILMLTADLSGTFLAGCKTLPVKKHHAASNSQNAMSFAEPARVSAATFAELKTGFVGTLSLLGDKVYQRKRKLIISKAPWLKKTILLHEKKTPTPHTLRPELLQSCQFIGVRIELDERIETAEWLVTTQGKGACQPTDEVQPQGYWLIMHKPKQQPVVIASGRARSFQLWRKGKGEALKRFEVNKYNQVKGVEILCYQEYQSVGNKYVPGDKRTEGYIASFPDYVKVWQRVDEQKYQCRP